jgi:hypothetical protein
MSVTSLEEQVTPIPQEALTVPFAEYSLRLAAEIVKARADETARLALAFYNGDHWQDGEGWIGPQYDSTHKLYSETMLAIKRTFISHNVVAEMTERHVAGVLARELHWSLTVKRPLAPIEETDPVTKEVVVREGEPTAAENALIQEAQTALVEWWNKRNVLETLKHALRGLLCIRRAPLRFSIPPGLRDQNGNLPRADLAGSLDYLYLDHMGYDEDTQEQILPAATVWINKNSRQPVGIFWYRENNEERAEICYVDEQGFTVLRLIDGDGNVGEPYRMALGGRILMYEMTRKALITKQIMSQQRSLNKTLSMKDRNDTQGGYLERFLLNIKWPGKEVVKPDGTVEFVPDIMHTGPGTVNSLQGAEYTDESGITHVLNPQVQFRDPVPATTFIESADHTYAGMLKEGNQLHYATKDLAISGESRKQARDAYTKDLQSSANVVEAAARWVLETALAEASFLAGQPGRFDGLRAYVQAKIDPGPVSPDDMRVAAEMLDRGLWDWETAVSATGVDDVDAVKQRLTKERAEETARMVAFQGAEGEEDQEEGQGEESTRGLNGIQIRAASEILDRVASGETDADNAIELLVSLGIERERASGMVGRSRQKSTA